LMSSDWNSGDGPSLRIRIGESFLTRLQLFPIEGMAKTYAFHFFILIVFVDSLGSVIEDCSRLEDSSTASDASFQMASAWLKECLSSHPNCSAYHGDIPELPTRVVDVGSSSGSERPYLHVSSKDQRGRYLTLSHRWGSSKSLEATKTVEENLAQNRSGMDLESLPLTFQHAIDITRKFGYRYLWIDSLCIIQDSGEDWITESQKMGDIYRRADFTIATIDATSADSGCFFPRDGQTLRPCQLDIYRPPPKVDTYSSYTGKIFVSRATDMNKTRASSLDGRGWCLQERTLSTRTLSYGKRGLGWECVTTECSEITPCGLVPDAHESHE
jgi:hypothetical protein